MSPGPFPTVPQAFPNDGHCYKHRHCCSDGPGNRNAGTNKAGLKQGKGQPSSLQHPQFHLPSPHHTQGSKTGKCCSTKAGPAAARAQVFQGRVKMQNATAFLHLYYSILKAQKALTIQLQLLLEHWWTLSGFICILQWSGRGNLLLQERSGRDHLLLQQQRLLLFLKPLFI